MKSVTVTGLPTAESPAAAPPPAAPERVSSSVATTRQTIRTGRTSGRIIVAKSNVTLHATGSVQGGKKFWSTKDPGEEPFTYEAGVGGVIVGWDQGCLGMREGEVRLLVIPGEEGYGKEGFPAWGIPPDATLCFELECLEVEGEGSELQRL